MKTVTVGISESLEHIKTRHWGGVLWENFTYVNDKNRQAEKEGEEAWKDGRKEENEKKETH